MFYKNWPYWLKGGTFFEVIYLLILGYALSSAHTCTSFLCELSAPYALVGFAWPIHKIFFELGLINSSNLNIFVSLWTVVNLILVFVIGALFGLIYGKIKSKK